MEMLLVQLGAKRKMEVLCYRDWLSFLSDFLLPTERAAKPALHSRDTACRWVASYNLQPVLRFMCSVEGGTALLGRHGTAPNLFECVVVERDRGVSADPSKAGSWGSIKTVACGGWTAGERTQFSLL